MTPYSPADGSEWECLKHALYRPDLAASALHLFSPLRNYLGGHRFQTDAQVQEAVSQRFHSPRPEFYADKTLWQTPEPSVWLCGEVGHCLLMRHLILYKKFAQWSNIHYVFSVSNWPTYVGCCIYIVKMFRSPPLKWAAKVLLYGTHFVLEWIIFIPWISHSTLLYTNFKWSLNKCNIRILLYICRDSPYTETVSSIQSKNHTPVITHPSQSCHDQLWRHTPFSDHVDKTLLPSLQSSWLLYQQLLCSPCTPCFKTK
jgi:hypothetical protein